MDDDDLKLLELQVKLNSELDRPVGHAVSTGVWKHLGGGGIIFLILLALGAGGAMMVYQWMMGGWN